MLTLTILFTFLASGLGEMIIPGLDRTLSDGVKSKGYKIVYGDEDLTVINEVVSDFEKQGALKSVNNNKDAFQPLQSEDVKCLMSADKYCSKNMREMKNVIIQAIKEDCVKCTDNQKEEAGKIIASMMAHDPSAWKLFLTRSALETMPEKKHVDFNELNKLNFRTVGKPEIVENSRNRFTLPGFKVRVKRYAAELL